MNDPITILQAFSAAVEQGNAEAGANLFTSDATYEEPPVPMLRGHDALFHFLSDFAERHSAVTFAIGRAFADATGERIASEWRFAYTRNADGTQRVFEGMSILTFDANGHIASWRGFSARLT